MMNNYFFRDFKSNDYAEVIDLWEKTGLGNKMRGDDLETIELSINLGGKFIIMEEISSQKIIGTSWMTFDGRRIHLHHFGIDPEYQGRKLFIPLIKKTLRFARDKNVQIKLEVHKDNLQAIKLYTKNHFKYLGDYKIFIIRDVKELKDIGDDQE
ncbi:MAG: GNAT family N-acetyltransferase [Candidatus Aminicenantes bacterium]|nr:GNAT family N-acetyltransferase [Candidatus Aminicenantes bacterium]